MSIIKVHELGIRGNTPVKGSPFYLNKKNIIIINPILNDKTHSSILMIDGSYLKVFEDPFYFDKEDYNE